VSPPDHGPILLGPPEEPREARQLRLPVEQLPAILDLFLASPATLAIDDRATAVRPASEA